MSPIPCQRPHTGKTLFVNVVISRAALGSGNLQTIFVSHIPVVVAAAAVANLGWGMIVSPQSPSEPALPSLQCVLSPSASWPYALKNSLNFAPRLLWVCHGGGFVALSDCILHLQLGSIQWLTSFFQLWLLILLWPTDLGIARGRLLVHVVTDLFFKKFPTGFVQIFCELRK